MRRGWITAAWGVTESNRRARYYRLTRLGENRLAAERQEWERVSMAIDLILRSV
jgi:DNA-binding PadR family transcriptional regulator